MTAPEYFTASDGVRLAYRVDDFTDAWKPAPVLVLIHPGMGSAERLQAWVPHFAREYRVVRPDLRGHGRSDAGLDQPLTLERLGLDLLELFDHLGIAQAHVMGSSAGGIIAMDAALQVPARFASLALFAATPGIHPSRPKKGNWLERVGRNGVRHFLNETVHDRIGEASPEMIRWYLDTAEGVTPEFLGRFVPLLASHYFPEKLAAFDFPVLMCVPEPDPSVEDSEYALMRTYLRHCTYVGIPGGGHGMTAQIPDECSRVLRGFLSGLGRPAATDGAAPRITPADPAQSAELALVYDRITATRGYVSGILASMSHAPDGLGCFAALGEYVRYRSSLSGRPREFRHHGQVDDDTFASVQQKLGDRGITDLTITCAYFLGLGSIVNAFRVPLEPDFPPQMKPVHD
jgi:pimeloyl-ACP methyl ester carboxylesterase